MMSSRLSRRPFIAAAAILTLLTVFLTWPQARYPATKFAALNDDPPFSAWRIAWIAHALRTDPRQLFNANIYYPQPGTLTYSDATLLEGVLAAPLFWVGLPTVLIYNLLLFAGFLSSGLAMFLLVRHLTNSWHAALVAAAIFTVAPYRIEHVIHLELQWTAWMPLAFLAAHRAVENRSWRDGLLAGVCVWLQFLSCVYYGIFLGMIVAVLSVLLLATHRDAVRAALPGLIAGGLLAIGLSWPYARLYFRSADVVGTRSWEEISALSARPYSYLASPPGNWLWGWTAGRWGGNELSLFPGLIALLLAAAALIAGRPKRLVWVYAATAAAAMELSFGAHGRVYTWLHDHVWVLHALRAPSRFGILVVCGLSVVAGLGYCVLERLAGGSDRRRGALLAMVVVALAIDTASAPISLTDIPNAVPEVYRIMRSRPPAVTLELPVTTLDRLPGFDPIYMYWSTFHWNPLVNGYGGFLPPSYALTLETMRNFPDEESFQRLKRLHVHYIVVHRQFYEKKDYEKLLDALLRRHDLEPSGRSRDWTDEAVLFELN